MPSPICLVKFAEESYVSTIDGVNVDSNEPVYIKLYDTTGVITWAITLEGTDELSITSITSSSNNAVLPQTTINVGDTTAFNSSGTFFIKDIGQTITYSGKTSTSFTGCSGGVGTLKTGQLVYVANLSINHITKIATYTSPAPGTALIFKSVINGGVDNNGVVQPSYTTKFGVYTLATSGLRVGAVGETNEGSVAFGWATKINPLARNLVTLVAGNAGAGLALSGQTFNVGQNADNSITVNANDIQLKAAYQTLLDGATVNPTVNTLVKRDGTTAGANLGGSGTLNAHVTYGQTIVAASSAVFGISQTTKADDDVPQPITITSQAGFASATGVNKIPGNIDLVIPSPSNSGTVNGVLNLKVAGATMLTFGKADIGGEAYISRTGSMTIGASATVALQGNTSITFGTSIATYGTISPSTIDFQSAGSLYLAGVGATTLSGDASVDMLSNGDITATCDNLFDVEASGGILLNDITGTGLSLKSTGAAAAISIEHSGNGVSVVPQLTLKNTTAAISGTQQASFLKMVGQGWKTTATAASQEVAYYMHLLPIQGTTNPNAQLRFMYQINGGAIGTAFYHDPNDVNFGNSVHNDCFAVGASGSGFRFDSANNRGGMDHNGSDDLRLKSYNTKRMVIETGGDSGGTGSTERFAIESNGSIALGAAGSFGSGAKVVFIAEATTEPTTDPSSGGILYVRAGALKYRGSSGTVTTIANA